MNTALQTAPLFDFGLLVLIWIVQTLLYPNFRFIDPDQFKTWHRDYTKKMGYIAAPLMIGQLAIASLQLYHYPTNAITLSYFALTCSSWAATFLISVPLHKQLQTVGKADTTIDRLVSTNWIRTGIWTALAALSGVQLIHP